MGFVLCAVGAGLCGTVCAYLGLLAVLGGRARDSETPPPGELSVVVVVPAYNEEAGIAVTVRSLLQTNYPPHLRRVLVLADNCQDATAQRAEAAGAQVWKRNDPEHRGKGFALEWAFNRLLQHDPPDVIAVVDADTVVSTNFLQSISGEICTGATAVQADYRVRNLSDSWRTRLMAIAMGMFHHTRSLARRRLGVSAGLRGNGMAFTWKLLSEVPPTAHSVVEDVEYGLQLALAGHRVRYLPHAQVFGEMPANGSSAASQRQRWEGGRRLLRKRYLRPLLHRAISRRSLTLLEMAADLLVPPLSTIVLAMLVGTCATAVVVAPMSALAWWGPSWLFLTLYLARGIQHSELGWGAFTALACAPLYIVWKLATVRPWRAPRRWVRTARNLRPNP